MISLSREEGVGCYRETKTHGKGFVSIYILQLQIIKLVKISILSLSLHYLYFVTFVLFIDIYFFNF